MPTPTLSPYAARGRSSYRNDAGTDYLSSTDVPSPTNWTVCGWAVKRVEQSATNQWMIGADNDSTSIYQLMGWASSGSFVILNNTGGQSSAFSVTPGLNEPFFFAMSCAGTAAGDHKGYIRRLRDTAFSTQSIAGSASVFTRFRIGATSFPRYLRGCYWSVRVWNAVLSAAEIAQEFLSPYPAHASNLHAWYPLEGNIEQLLRDYSGNGRHLTRAGSGRAERFFLPASVLMPLVDDAAVDAAAGGGAITGSAAPTLTGATGSSTGTVNNRASAAPTLAAASASASGLITVAASAAPTLAAATAAAAGAIDNRATAAPATAGATAAASGIVDNRASAAPQLDAATASAVGTVGNVINGTAAITLGAATSAATALVDNRASAAVQLAGGTAAASGTIDNRASAAAQLGAATASASGAVGTTDILGSAAPQLAAAIASGIAQIIVSGAAAVTLAGAVASGSGLAGDVFVPIGGGRRRIGSNSADGGSARIGSATVRTGKRRIGSSNP